MQVRPRKLSVYETSKGKAPFEEWMDALKDLTGKATVEARLNLLRQGSLGKKYEHVGDGIVELKIEYGPGYRIYIADGGTNSLILCAGSKRKQKQDIKAAKKYWADYSDRSS